MQSVIEELRVGNAAYRLPLHHKAETFGQLPIDHFWMGRAAYLWSARLGGRNVPQKSCGSIECVARLTPLSMIPRLAKPTCLRR